MLHLKEEMTINEAKTNAKNRIRKMGQNDDDFSELLNKANTVLEPLTISLIRSRSSPKDNRGHCKKFGLFV